jgi:uncharacterized protein
VDVQNDNSETPLHMASCNGKFEIAHLLVKCGSNMDSKDQNGGTPLHIAALEGHLDIVELLIQLGTDVNMWNLNEETSLDLACRHGKHDIAHFLSEKMGVGEVGHVVDTCMITLDTESQNVDSDIVKASPSHRQDETFIDNRSTLLVAASWEGNLNLVWTLLHHGTDVKEQDKVNGTPLHQASQ